MQSFSHILTVYAYKKHCCAFIKKLLEILTQYNVLAGFTFPVACMIQIFDKSKQVWNIGIAYFLLLLCSWVENILKIFFFIESSANSDFFMSFGGENELQWLVPHLRVALTANLLINDIFSANQLSVTLFSVVTLDL